MNARFTLIVAPLIDLFTIYHIYNHHLDNVLYFLFLNITCPHKIVDGEMKQIVHFKTLIEEMI